jgi:hypothetical protein
VTQTPEPGPDGWPGPASTGLASTGLATTGAATTARRPPVRQSTVVRSDVRHTFEVFVRTIGTWWPADPFSAGKDRVRDIVIEPHTGGRVYEIWADGTEVDWGDLLAWDRPPGS